MTTPAIPLANVPISTSAGQITLPWQRFFLSLLDAGGSINAVVNGKTISVSAIDIGAGLAGTVTGGNLVLTSGLAITESGETLEQVNSLVLKGNFGLSGSDGSATITAPDGAVQIAAYGVILNEAASVLNFTGNIGVNSIGDEVFISVGAPIIQNGGTSIGSATTFNVTAPLTTSIAGNVATTGFEGISAQQGTASLGAFIDLDIGAGLVGTIGTGSLAGTLSLANAGVISLSGTSGTITLGSNLSLSGQTLNAAPGGTLVAIEGTASISVGTLHAGANVSFSGASPNLTINGSSTMSANITVENQGTSIGTAGTINATSPVTASVAGGVASFTSSGGSGGYPAGTVPTVVQVAYNTAGGNGATFASAPTNGNLLVAINFNPTSNTAGTGWTLQTENTAGTDYGSILTKTAGVSEPAAQTPMSGVSTTGATVIWEISGQNATTPFVVGASQTQATGIATTQVPLPNSKNCLGLAAVGVIPSASINTVLNIGTQDVLSNTNSRYIAAGHTDLSKTPFAGLIAVLSVSGSSKAATCLISS